MSKVFITIILGVIVSVSFLVVPLVATSSQNDDITQTAIQAILADFVNTAAKEGQITQSNYNELISKLHATGNTYNVKIEVQVLDDNPGSKGPNIDVIGENIYYSIFNVEEEVENNGVYLLKTGNRIIATAENTNITDATRFWNAIYKIVGHDTIAIKASVAALCTTTIDR